MTLPEFLLERLDEREAVARDMQHHAWFGYPMIEVLGGGNGIRELIDPDRVLAECVAVRAVVALHTPGTRTFVAQDGESFDVSECPTCWVVTDDGGPLLPGAEDRDEVVRVPDPCPTLRELGEPHADHQDYREEWRP